MSFRSIVCAIPICIATHALGQYAGNYNIDLNSSLGVPSSSYGGAVTSWYGGGGAGPWNVVNNTAAGHSVPLVNSLGNATGATWTNVTSGGALFSFNNPGTSGDDEALLDDGFIFAPQNPRTYAISGLDSGLYNVFVYAWAPDSPTFLTGIRVNGGFQQVVGGAWTGHHQLGITFAHFDVFPINGTITITATAINFGTINGVQLGLYIPVPACFPILAGMMLAAPRRRRRSIV